MRWLLACCSVILFTSTCALPSIVNPGQENVGLDRVTLTWEVSGSSSDDFKFEIVVKEFEQALNPNIKGFETTLPKDRRQTVVTDLKSGTTYAATIKAITDSNTGSLSTRIVFTTKGIKPPRHLRITTITDTMITFEWSPPTGQAIDATKIKLKNNENGVISSYNEQQSPISEFSITGLKPGTPYIVKIQSRLGDQLSTEVTTGLRMAVGTIGRVQLRKVEATSATVEWTSPQITDDYKIKNYEVVLIKNAASTNSTGESVSESFFTSNSIQTSYDLSNLIPSQFYAVKVRTIYQELGHGPFSEPTVFQTVRQEIPTTPLSVRVDQATKKSVQIFWSKPEYKHTIAEYEIEYAIANTRPQPTIFTNGATANAVVGNLESGTNYTVKVRAIGENKITGHWSVKVAFKTKGPRPVSSVSLTEITDTSVKVSWTTYTGSKADKFVVSYMITDKSTTTKKVDVKNDQLFYHIKGLTPSTPYVIQVYAVSGGDESTPKKNGLRTNINIDILSEQPKNVQIKETSKQSEIEVSFDKVPNQLVKFYEVQVQGFDIPNVPFIRQLIWVPRTSDGDNRQSGIINEMQSGWRYKVIVRAIYGNDETGTWSTPAAILVSGPKPPRVINIFEITDRSANVHWKPGYEDNEKDIPNNLQYNVTLYELLGNSNSERFVATHVSSSKNSYLFNQGIEPTMRYRVKIFSRYRDGSTEMKSTVSELAFRANSARPPAPTLISRSVKDNTATIFWNRIPNRSDIAFYEIHLVDLKVKNTQQFTTKNALEESFRFTGLQKSQFYEFKVRGIVNKDQKGMWLVDNFYVPGAPIKRVDDVNVLKRTSNSVTLIWKAGERADLKMYEIELKSQERGLTETVVTNGLTNSFKLEDLHSGTTYTYRIRAVSINENDKGQWSVSQSFRTEDASPLGSSMSKGIIVGIALAVIALIIIVIVAVMICRKRRGQPFEKFDGSVKFQRNQSQDGGLPAQEMDDTATAIRNGKKLYI